MKTMALALLLAATNTFAGDLWLDINSASYHDNEKRCYQDGDKCKKYTESNPGFGLSYGLSNHVDLAAGFYKNSQGNLATYASTALKHDFKLGWLTVTPGIELGFTTGYEDKGYNLGPLRPGGNGFIRLGNEQYRVELGIVPGKLLPRGLTNLYMLQFGWKL